MKTKTCLVVVLLLSISHAYAEVPFGCANQILPNYHSGEVKSWVVEFDGAFSGSAGTGSFNWLWTDGIQRDNVMTDFQWNFGGDRQGGFLDNQSEHLPDGTLVSRFTHGIPVFEMLTGLSTEWRDPLPTLVFKNTTIDFGSSIVYGKFPDDEERIIFSAGLLSPDRSCFESLATYSFQYSGQTFSGHMKAYPAFQINAGLNDAWFSPLTSGQGFFIIVWEDQKTVFLAWFTYDTERPPDDVTAILGEPGHRWITALGPYDGDTALLDVFLSSGMIFDSGVPLVDITQYPGATLEIVWTSCKAGIVKYNIPSLNLMGEVPIERIVEDNVAACLAAQP